MDATAYLDQSVQLLPQGKLWNAGPDTTLGKLLAAFAEGAARLDARTAQLLQEADPRATLELLAAWEELAGLPDSCTGQPNNINERRVALWTKYTQLGGQTPAYYEGIALTLGYRVRIHEYRPADCNSRCDDDCAGDDWAHVWRVDVLAPEDETSAVRIPQPAYATCNSDCDAYLIGFGALDIQCIISRAKPAQTIVNFAYPDAPEPFFYFDFIEGL